MKGLSNSTVKMIRFIELYLCPQYCGVIDRRRVIAYLFFTLIEAVVIPLHFFLFLMFWEPMGFGLTCASDSFLCHPMDHLEAKFKF